jgi:hypothetical protein
MVTSSLETRMPPRALARLDFVWERVGFGVQIDLYLFAFESLKFGVHID